MSTASKDATHYTSIGTRKFQCNGPTDWAKTFKMIAESIGGKGTPEGVGIRAVLAAGVKAAEKGGAGVAKLGESIEAELLKERSEMMAKIAKKAKAKPAKKQAAKKPAATKPAKKGGEKVTAFGKKHAAKPVVGGEQTKIAEVA